MLQSYCRAFWKYLRGKSDFGTAIDLVKRHTFDWEFKQAFERTVRRFLIQRIQNGQWDEPMNSLWGAFENADKGDDIEFKVAISFKEGDAVFMPMLYEEAKLDAGGG